ncbi:tRNA pseudouridine(13) synthase TruD [Candidatus Woesearchaeota archaeon]|jgi:tRNA pseudouridine13 synthase|nr:tRNA pseudouridine(13) synthase TruD [Candidatus Woesearchaeota archaeon]
MYIIKQQPEDFIVTEINHFDILEKGRYIYFKLKKRNRTVLDVIKEIAKQLNLKEKQIGFAGTKDKNAITEQFCSVQGTTKEKLLKVNLENVSLEFIGYNPNPLSLGELEGNHFEITVRNLEEFSIEPTTHLPNYFDEQRFSTHNIDIGKHLIKKEFKEATKLIDDTRSEKHLGNHPQDFVGALKKLPNRLLKMYIHAYQSYLWNETLSTYLKNQNQQVKEVPYSAGTFIFIKNPEPFLELNVPLIGFASEDLETNEQIKEIIHHSMLKENISYRDFIIKQIPELSSEGGTRTAFIEVKELKIEDQQPDELTPGKNKIKISFILGKGSYATLVIKKILNTLK